MTTAARSSWTEKASCILDAQLAALLREACLGPLYARVEIPGIQPSIPRRPYLGTPPLPLVVTMCTLILYRFVLFFFVGSRSMVICHVGFAVLAQIPARVFKAPQIRAFVCCVSDHKQFVVSTRRDRRCRNTGVAAWKFSPWFGSSILEPRIPSHESRRQGDTVSRPPAAWATP